MPAVGSNCLSNAVDRGIVEWMKRKKPAWRPSDIAKASAEAELTGTEIAPKGPQRSLREVGARAIYEFRAHPRKVPWPQVSPEKQAPYLERIDSLLAVIKRAGYAVRAG